MARETNVHEVSQSRQKSATDVACCASINNSFKCWGRRPSSPPAERGWNDLTSARMADSDIRLFGCVLCVVALAAENTWVNFSSSTVASLKGTNLSLLTARRIAPQTSPSSSLLETVAASFLDSSLRFERTGMTSIFWLSRMIVFGKSEMRLFIFEAGVDEWRLPPRWPGTAKQQKPNSSNFFQLTMLSVSSQTTLNYN